MPDTAVFPTQIRESIIDTSYAKIGPHMFVMDQENKEKKRQPRFETTELTLSLVRRSREGDMQAMGSLYEHYKSRLFSLAYRYTYNSTDAEDLIQDIFLKVFTHIGTLENDDAFPGWMYRIAVNTCLSYLRSHKKRIQRGIPLSEVEFSLGENAQSGSEKMMEKPLEEAIQGLPTKLKSVFLLHDVQGFKHHEIAQILRCTVGTSKSQLFKARLKIRKKLEKKQLL